VSPLLLLLACATPDPSQDRNRYVQALARAAESPREAYWACRDIHDSRLRADCGLTGVEAIARQEDESTAALLTRCASLEDGLARDECAFQVAEIRDDASACGSAGRFADDCRLHLLSAGFATWIPRSARADDLALQEKLSARARSVGLGPEDERAWSAWFRWVLGMSLPLDRAVCESVPDASRRVACRETGRALYGDRLNHARDAGTYPCHGEPLPPDLATTPDPELDALRHRRETEDLCR